MPEPYEIERAKWVTVRKAAELLGISHQSVRERFWARDPLRHIPYTVVDNGRHGIYLVSRAWIERELEKQREQA